MRQGNPADAAEGLRVGCWCGAAGLEAPLLALRTGFRVQSAGVLLSQPGVSALVNGNVKAFALERVMQVTAALGATVGVSSKASKDEVRPHAGVPLAAPTPSRAG